jgi:hypothetical protein
MLTLTNPTWIAIKGGLFLLLGLLGASLLFYREPTLCTGLLLIITVWGFCRFYYFVFYVIVDPTFRFTGLFALARHFMVDVKKDRG